MNLHRINQKSIQATTPFQPVQLVTYAGKSFNMGDDTPVYNPPIEIMANIQLANKQSLQHLEGFNASLIYKRFFINAVITGLNRNISSGGDYLLWTEPNTGVQLKYKVIEVKNQFNVGYTEVIGQEGIPSE